MNNDQQTVAWMVVLLIFLTMWTTYKPWLKPMLFNSPQVQRTSFWTSGPGSVIGTGINTLGDIGSGGLLSYNTPANQDTNTGAGNAGTPTTTPASQGAWL